MGFKNRNQDENVTLREQLGSTFRRGGRALREKGPEVAEGLERGAAALRALTGAEEAQRRRPAGAGRSYGSSSASSWAIPAALAAIALAVGIGGRR